MRARFALNLKRYPLTCFSTIVPKKKAHVLHQLTSSVIDTTPNGDYPWNVRGLLEPHEMLRRELARGTKALDNFNLKFRPHQAYCFREWFESFMKEMLMEHQESEKKIMWPFFVSKGIRLPNSFVEDANKFERVIQTTLDAAVDLDNFQKQDKPDPTILQSKVNDLKSSYSELTDSAHRIFMDKERFWPNQYVKVGEEEFSFQKVRVGEFLHEHSPDTFLRMPCAILTCMGIAIEGSSFVNEPEEDKGWAGDALRARYYNALPKEVRVSILPAANRYYMAFRTLIDACNTDQNMLQIDHKIQQLIK